MNYQQQPIISGNTGGTPITQLRKDLVQNDLESNYSFDSIKTSSDIRQLVDEINNRDNNLNNDVKSVHSDKSENRDTLTDTDTDSESDTDTDKSINSEKKKKNKKCKKNFIKDSIYDGIILLVIFILMSQGFVKNFIGKHVKIINVNEEGYVPFKGVVAYGVIFVLVFLSTRLLINTIKSVATVKCLI
jgi:hypothetical protein